MFPYLLSIALPLYFFLHQTTSTLPINSPGLYSQQHDHVAVNCGSSGNSIAEDTRPWTGDTGSNYITSLHGSKSKLISSKVTDQVLPNDPIPYATARLSRWSFTYTFRVTPGQKLIRLHFYPASYQGGFKRAKSFFSVKAGPYTLLSNFSASLTSDALGLQYLVKEYCINVEEDQPLILMFSPSQSGNSDEVYAFVNGIEIISIPAALYHTPEGTPATQIIGKSDRFTVEKSIALEKVHRLNVGGSSISSIEDTGMFREWSEDSNYLLEKSTVKPASTTIRIKYTSIPPYTAPQKVYQTSWSLVPDKQADKTEFNFTWRLPVDLGFRYLLRLHFCELEYEIKETGRMEFSIFVNQQVVEDKGDLIKWSGGSGVAVYKDYVLMMEGDRMEGKRDFLVVLRPHNREWTEPIDATLKGLEVFKLSNHDKNLAGVNPVNPVPLATRALISPKPKKLVFASGGNAIATGVVILLTVLNVIVYQLRTLGENSVERNHSSSTSEGICRRFSLAEIISVTNSFDDELVIGRGGFGKVYKAIIDDGATTVALKRLNLGSKQGAKEFWTEIEMLSKLRHTHLVSLLGYCDERNEMILVYEFMEHGTLADHLYKDKTNGNGIVHRMSWKQRLNVCIGAARGLDYLHTGIRHGLIHRDVKTTNILLDKDFIAKISDFGLCKPGATSHSHTHVSTDVKGSFGYFDPDYFLTRRLTKKSDVYAFGVVMLEMLCGRPAIDMLVDEEQHSLVLWAKQGIKENRTDQLIDPSLRGQISAHCLKVFVDVANKCLDIRPKGRPTMADVVVRLDNALAVDEQFGETAPRDDFLPRGDAPSSSTLALYSENTQHQNRSKGKVSKVFQKTIAFLAKGADIKWQRTNVYSPNGENSPVSSTGTRRLVIEQLFLSSAASGPNEADLTRQILSTPDLRIFSLSQMKTATENFREDRLLGHGGFGRVYKGWLVEKNGNRSVKKLDGESTQGFKERQGLMPNGQEVAVKKLTLCSGQRHIESMINTVKLLLKIQHKNLVMLLGCCAEGPEKMLVYEYLPNGSLDRFLFDKKRSSSLDWLRRYRIVTGIAGGLLYLHEEAPERIIHRDITARNILLDGQLNPKISDSGFARLFPGEETHLVTYGYMAPEYVMHGCMSVKTDVFSFGVLVLEIVSGSRRRLERELGGEQEDLLTYAWTLFEMGKSLDLVDPTLSRCNPDEAAMCIQLGLLCCQDNVADRPDMNSVLLMLSSDSFTLPRPGVPGGIRTTTTTYSFIDEGTTKMKLNTDGSSRGNPGPAGFGGVFREERGHWVLGFYGRLEDCTSLEAELWGIFKGLELARSQNMEALEVESDSATAIELIKGETPPHSPHKTLIEECKAILAITGCILNYTYREGNAVADKLANIGVEQEHKWVSHIYPPVEIIPLLEADMRGVAFERV